MKAAVLIFVALDLCAWVVMMAGVAAQTDDCNSSEYDEKECGKLYGYQWWCVWFQFFATLAAGAIVATDKKAAAPTIQALFATLLSVTMYLSSIYVPRGANDRDALNAAAAGFVMCSIFNFLILIGAGVWHASDDVEAPPKEAHVAEKAETATAAP